MLNRFVIRYKVFKVRPSICIIIKVTRNVTQNIEGDVKDDVTNTLAITGAQLSLEIPTNENFEVAIQFHSWVSKGKDALTKVCPKPPC